MAEGVHGNEGAGFEMSFGCPNSPKHDMANGSRENVLRPNLNDAGSIGSKAAKSIPKSKSCVKTIQPLAAAKSKISVSAASGGPIVDQWTASKPWSARNATHSGLRFISIRNFTQPTAGLRFLRRATRHMTMPDGCPHLQDMDTQPRSR